MFTMPLLKMIKYSQADKLPICQRSLLICDEILQNHDFHTQIEDQPLNLPEGGRACIHTNRNQKTETIFLRVHIKYEKILLENSNYPLITG